MKIETKFNVGDEVWYIRHNKIAKSKISTVYFSFGEQSTNTSYQMRIGSAPTDFFELAECDAFATKEELINSL